MEIYQVQNSRYSPVTERKLKSAKPLPVEFCQIASKAGTMGVTSVPGARKPSLVKSPAISM